MNNYELLLEHIQKCKDAKLAYHRFKLGPNGFPTNSVKKLQAAGYRVNHEPQAGMWLVHLT